MLKHIQGMIILNVLFHRTIDLALTCRKLKSPNKYLNILSDIFKDQKANDHTAVIRIICVHNAFINNLKQNKNLGKCLHMANKGSLY